MGLRLLLSLAGPLMALIGGLPLLGYLAFASAGRPQPAGIAQFPAMLPILAEGGWGVLALTAVVVFGTGLYLFGLGHVFIDAARSAGLMFPAAQNKGPTVKRLSKEFVPITMWRRLRWLILAAAQLACSMA